MKNVFCFTVAFLLFAGCLRAAEVPFTELKDVTSATFSPDGKNIAISANEDKTFRLIDAASGKELRKFVGHKAAVISVAFSSDGKRIVSISRDDTARIWDTDTGRVILTFPQRALGERIFRSIVTVVPTFRESVAFSPDGKKVVTDGPTKTARIWDTKSGKILQELEGHTGGVRSVAFSHDGKKVVTGGWDKIVRIWDAESGKELQKFEGHTREVYSVAFSSDGKRVVSGSNDSTVRIWDVEKGMELKKFEGHTSSVNTAAFSLDGKRIVTGSFDKTVRIWDVESGKELKKLEGHTGSVISTAFSPDGKKVVSVSRFWDGAGNKWDKQTARIWTLE